jgi:hypothetical protein
VIATTLGLIAVGLILVVISLAVHGRSTGHGCVDVNVQAATGTSEIYRCGEQARALCSSVGKPAGPSGVLGDAVTAECRKAKLPVG